MTEHRIGFSELRSPALNGHKFNAEGRGDLRQFVIAILCELMQRWIEQAGGPPAQSPQRVYSPYHNSFHHPSLQQAGHYSRRPATAYAAGSPSRHKGISRYVINRPGIGAGDGMNKKRSMFVIPRRFAIRPIATSAIPKSTA
jgi:hypothetical protein